MNDPKIKTLIVDDTAFMRKALVDIFSQDPGIEVVGVAKHGEEALEAIGVLDPDVITLDVDMPVMNGLTTIKHIMVRRPRPIIMVSGLASQGQVTLEALRLGAVDFFPKPSGTISFDIHQQSDDLCRAVREAARMNPWAVRRARVGRPWPNRSAHDEAPLGLIVVGAHRGTSGSLIRLLSNINPALPVAFLIVQGIAPQVLESYSAELNRIVPWEVAAGKRTAAVHRGMCLISDYDSPWRLEPDSEGPGLRVEKRPSATLDDLLAECGQNWGERCLAVLLGGTSAQGVQGLKELRDAGGKALVLHPKACLYGQTAENAIAADAAEVAASEKDLWTEIEAFGRRLVWDDKSKKPQKAAVA